MTGTFANYRARNSVEDKSKFDYALIEATYAGSDDPTHAARRERVHRYLRLRHRTRGNAYHPLTRIGSVKPFKLERH